MTGDSRQHIICLCPDCSDAQMPRAAQELTVLRKNNERYKKVRKMNVDQFRNAYLLSLTTSKSFDEVMDDMRPAPTGAKA